MTSLFAFDDDACARLAAEHGTPCFAYSAAVAAAAYERLRAAVPERVRIAYAVKANPHPRLLDLLARIGCGFDCASEGELRRVAELKPGPGRVFYAGPGKRAAELRLALDLGVRVQAESWEDLVRLDRLAAGEVAVNLRVHPKEGAEESTPILGGVGPSAFGVDEEDVPQLAERACGLARLRLRGIHVFAATNQCDARKLLATYAMVLALARRFAPDFERQSGGRLEQIDLGGGLGIPYAEGEPPLSVSSLGAGLERLIDEHAWFRGELILEPGRYIAGPAGVYLARVVRVKRSRGTLFAVLEGGINHLLRPHFTGQPFPVKAVGKQRAGERMTLAGPLCTSLDRLGEATLPPLEPGDLLAFGAAGAYGFTEGMTHFLSHPVPPEIWVEG